IFSNEALLRAIKKENQKVLQSKKTNEGHSSQKKLVVAPGQKLTEAEKDLVETGVVKTAHLPDDMVWAMKNGLLPKNVLVQFFKRKDQKIISMIMSHGKGTGPVSEFRSRLLADPNFLLRMMFEQAIGISLTTLNGVYGREDWESQKGM